MFLTNNERLLYLRNDILGKLDIGRGMLIFVHKFPSKQGAHSIISRFNGQAERRSKGQQKMNGLQAALGK